MSVCVLQINYYAMQNTAAAFEDPHRFWPERWLRSSSPGAEPQQDWDDMGKLSDERGPLAKAFLPYSAGPRSCIGQPLAMMEVGLCRASLCHVHVKTVKACRSLLSGKKEIIRLPMQTA